MKQIFSKPQSWKLHILYLGSLLVHDSQYIKKKKDSEWEQ